TLLRNDSLEFDEPYRQKLLINEARKLPGKKKIFITLDADEFISFNFLDSKEWDMIKSSNPGTVFTLPWVNVLDQFKCWIPFGRKKFIYVDDGSNHQGAVIHSERIP